MLITTALSVLFYALLLSGVGWLAFPRAQALPVPRFWIGLALALAYLQIWHLLAPVTALTLLPLLAAGMVGGWRARKHLPGWLHSQHPARMWLFGGLALALLLLYSNQVLWSEFTLDHGMYHLPMVRWIEQYAIVPGLGNLHHRLAFNNSSFLLAAQMDVAPLPGLAFYSFGPLLMWVVSLTGLSGLLDVLMGRHHLHLSRIFEALLLPAVLYTIGNSSFAGYSPDLLIFTLEIVLASALLRLFDSSETPQNRLPAGLTAVTLLCAAGVTVKLSFAAYGGAALAAALWAWGWRVGFRRNQWPRWLAWAGSGALLIVPWLVRGVILSGYPLYPSTLLPFNVAWRIPEAMVAPVAGIIRMWARYRSAEPPVGTPFERFLFWQGSMAFEIKEAAGLFLLLLAAALLFWLVFRRSPAHWRGLLAVMGVSLVALVYWLIMAPDPRFAGAVPWLLPAAALMLVFQQVAQALAGEAPHRLVSALVILALFWLSPNFSNNFSFSRLLTPPSISTLAEENHVPEAISKQVTASGLAVYVADYRSGESCWDAPLPCTRANDFDPRLELLQPGNLQGGFRLNLGR